MLQQLGDVRGADLRAGVLQPGGGDAGGDAHVHVEREHARLLQEQLDPRPADHVGDLVGVHEHGGGAVAHGGAGELDRAEHAALDVEMGVHEARRDDAARHVQHLRVGGGRAALRHDPGDDAPADQHVRAAQGARGHVHEGAAGQQQWLIVHGCNGAR